MKKLLIGLLILGSLSALSEELAEKTIRITSHNIIDVTLNKATCEKDGSIDISLNSDEVLTLEYEGETYRDCDYKVITSNNNADRAFAIIADIFHGDITVNSTDSGTYCEKTIGYLIVDPVTKKARELQTKLIAAKCP